jgi:DNA-binding NarL/FixJ family response regulator
MTATAIGVRPLEESALTIALDLNPIPYAIVRDDGAVIFANRAARRTLDHVTMSRLRSLAGTALPTTPAMRLVALADGDPVDSLPPSLRRIARLLTAGLADKEIADRLEMPLTTVRTYVQRIFRRLKISSRRLLVRRPLTW